MNSQMRVKLALGDKTLSTVDALERLLSGVGAADVILEVFRDSVGLVAVLAFVRALTRVLAAMNRQMRSLCERPPAVGARVGPLARVSALVHFEAGMKCESCSALWLVAFKWFLTSVRELVPRSLLSANVFSHPISLHL